MSQTPGERSEPVCPELAGGGVSSLVRKASSPSESQGEADSSLVRSPADAKADTDNQAPAKPLDLQELFAEVNALGGKIVRQGKGFGVTAGGAFLLLSPTLKASLDAHADELELVTPQSTLPLAAADAHRSGSKEYADAWLSSLDPEAKAFYEELRNELSQEPEAESYWDRPSQISKENAALWHTSENDPCPYERMIAFRRLVHLPLPEESKEQWLADLAESMEQLKKKHRG